VLLVSERVRYMLSPVRLSVVCNARAPYSGGSNFRQYFYGIRYLGHPLTCTENFMMSSCFDYDGDGDDDDAINDDDDDDKIIK